MDVAITGASGLDRPRAVELVARRRAPGAPFQRGGVTEGDTIGWDPDAGRIDAPALEGIDAVVHLAGEGIAEKQWTDEQKRRIRDSRVRGTAVLAAAVASRERKPRVLVSGSAIGYYGNRGDEVLTEESAPGDDFLAGGLRRVGSGDRARGRSRRANGAHAHRHRARRARRRAEADALAVQARRRRPPGFGQAVDELDRARRRGRRDPLRDRERGAARPGQPRGAEPGHQRRVRRHARPGAAPADVPAHAAAPAEAAVRRRARRDRCCWSSQRVAPAQLQAAGYQFAFSSLEDALRAVVRT